MATPTKTGTEFQANTYTSDNQSFVKIAGLADGGFVAIWESEGQDTSLEGVYGQRYNSDGARAGTEFKVSTHITDEQYQSSVATLANGEFVVTWESYNQDGHLFGIYGQRYNTDGTRAGLEFKINTETADDQRNSEVTGLADGGFVVTWDSYNQDAGGTDNGVFGQRYNADGTRAGLEFQVNTHTPDQQEHSSVTALEGGGFVVTWDSLNQDGSNYGIYGQRYNADGSRVGIEFKVNNHTASTQSGSSVTSLEDGGFVVTWTSLFQDGGGFGIFAQRYNSDGMPVGIEFQVNSHTTDDQQNSAVTSLADGGFIVTWESYTQDTLNNNGGVYAQRFNADGTKNGTEFLVNTETTDDQSRPAISVLANGEIVIIWQSNDQDAGGTDYGIYGQIFSIDLFSAGDDTIYLPSIGPSGGWQALGGDDYVIGSDAADSVDGGDGSDWLYGGGGDDTINAGAGAMDVSLGDGGNDTINGEGGMDYMYGYAGNDAAHGGEGDDVAYGGAGNDELYGDDGADWLFGEAGNDKLFGGAGADLLMGGAGTDEITGGAGNDWLWGGDMAGAGDGVADTFFFGTNWGGDVIWDFEDGKDMLDVSGAGITSFADLSIGTFGQFTTITSASGDIIYLRGAGDVAVAESSIDASDFIFA